MQPEADPRDQLLAELRGLRRRVAELEAAEADRASRQPATSSRCLFDTNVVAVIVSDADGSISQALCAALGDQVYLSPAVAGRVKGNDPRSTLKRLSERECEVLQLLAAGGSAREIADRLGLSTKTVHAHRKHIMEKLELGTLAGLVKYAIRVGLTSSEPE